MGDRGREAGQSGPGRWGVASREGKPADLAVTGSDACAVSHRAIRREARRIVTQMPLPRPFDLDQLIANVEAVRGRRIKLLPLPDRLLGGTDICGLWLRHARLPLDLILHVETTTPYHRQRIILHELAHLWCDDVAGVAPDQLAKLLPGFSEALIVRLASKGQVMARRRYDSHAEIRAEILAGLIHEEGRAYWRTETDETLRNLDETLSGPRSGWPLAGRTGV